MFVELTTNEGKTMVNTSNVAYFKPYSYELRNGNVSKGTHIHFVNPTSHKGQWAILVNESYEEVKRMIMEG